MSLISHLYLHWRRYTILERMLVLFPLTLVTPVFIPFVTSLTHDGETTHEFVVSIYLFVILIVGIKFQGKGLIAFPRIGSVEFFVCCFAFWTACSLLWTSSIGATLDQIVIWADYAVLMLLATSCLRRRSKIGLATLLMVTAGLMAAIKLIGYAMAEGSQPENTPLYKNIGVETEILVTLVPIFWIVFLTARRKQLLVTTLIVSIVCIMASISSYQRTPLLSLMGAIGIIVTYVLAGWFRPKLMSRALILVLAIIFSYGIQTNLPAKLYGFSGTEFLAMKIADESNIKSSAAVRFILWGTALEMLIRHPLLGVGGGAYKAEYSTYRAFVNQHSYLPAEILAATFTPDQSDGSLTNFRAHNEFFQVLGELGFVGGLVLLVMLFRLVQNLFRLRKKAISSAVVSGVVAFLISSNFTSFSFRWIPCGLAFFLIISLVSSKDPASDMAGASNQKWFLYLVMTCLLLCCFRTSQVLVSQHFEAKANLLGEDNSNIARNNYQLALFVDSYNFTARFKLGMLFYRTREPEKAMPLLETAMNLGINDVASFQALAFVQAHSGEWKKAEKTLKRGLQMCPSSIFLRTGYAELLMRRGEVEPAKLMLSEARKINRELTDSTEGFWGKEKNNANKYTFVTRKLGSLWDVMISNRRVELNYQKTK